MFFKSTGKADPLPEDTVALQPIFGVRPGVYLAFLYSLIALAALAAILVLPGVLHPGSLVELRSQPRGAAVRMDGAYVGTTPCAVFVARGGHEFTFVMPGFAASAAETEVGSRLFGSWLFPRRQRIEASLETADPVAAFALGAAEFAAWSFVGDPTVRYQVPLALSEAAYRSAGRADAADFMPPLKAAARFAVTAAGFRDLVRAVYLIDSGGVPGGPVSLARGARTMLDYLSSAPGASAWLAAALPEALAAKVKDSAWQAKQSAAAAALKAAAPAAGGATGRTVRVGPLTFIEIAAGDLVPAGSWPRRLQLASFWIADREVDEAAWAAFTAAEPAWSAANAAALVAAGQADDGYLADVSQPDYPKPSRSGVSWYAAQAFCTWLGGSLPARLGALTVRLPTEAEWESAAGLALPLAAPMAGGLWEWCADAYAPLDFLPAGSGVASPQRSVRGGSWANPGKMPIGTRAGLEPAVGAPFVGFRPVIAAAIAP